MWREQESDDGRDPYSKLCREGPRSRFLLERRREGRGCLVSPPDGFPVLSQALARWVPPRFDVSHPAPTSPSLAGKPTAGSCRLSTIMMVHMSRDARTPIAPSDGKAPRFCLECRCTACANPRSIRLAAFSRPLSRCSPLSHHPPLLYLFCVNTTRGA